MPQSPDYPAMRRAGIPRLGEKGGMRTFHSFWHSFARAALQAGVEVTWLQRQLGHATYKLTVDLYGSWERKAEKCEAERVPVGAFAV